MVDLAAEPKQADENVASSNTSIKKEPKDIEASSIGTTSRGSQHERPQISTIRWTLTLIGLYIGALLYGLDTTIAADVQTAIYFTFNDIERLALIGALFPMAASSIILLMGRLFGLVNIKILTSVSFLLFEIGSALCGAAPTMTALLIGRAIAGLGGAGMYLGALTYVSVYGAGPQLPLYNACIGLSWGVGAILGPIVGGAFSVSPATWRWAFYINLPLAAVVAPIYIFAMPAWSASQAPLKEKLKLDWVGAILNAAVFSLVILALTFSGSVYAWNSSQVIGLWTGFGVALVAWIVQQYFSLFTKERLFPGHYFRNYDLMLLALATFCAAVANSVTLYFIPLFFAFTRGDSALEAAVRLLPFIIIFIVFIMLAGGGLPVIGYYKAFYVVGAALTVAGTAAMLTVRSDTSVAKVYGYEVLIAAGTGLVFQNAYAVASAKVHDKSNAIGFINVSQIGFIAISLAIAGCLFQNLGFSYLSDALAQYNLPEELIRGALGGVNSSALASAPQEVIDIVIATVAFTISRVFILGLAASAILFLASLAMTWEKLDLTIEAGG